MKKTFTLLLAAASVAMAATEIDLTDKWSGDTANISSETFTDGKATFFLTLNLEQLAAWTTADGNITLGYLSAVNNYDQNVKLGLGIDSSMGYLCMWKNRNDKDNFFGTTSTLPLPENIDGVDYSYASLVFTVYTDGNNSYGNSYLFLWDENHSKVDELTSNEHNLSTTLLSDKSYSGFTINSAYVNSDQVALYNGQLSTDQDPYAIAKSLLPAASTPGTGSTVPEPATATLSLMALAGLAARRRRK